jgi:hypothetical protein
MRYAVIGKMTGMIGLMILGASLFAQGNKSRSDILDIAKNAPRPGIIIEDAGSAAYALKKDMEYFTSKLVPADVPIIYDLVLDKTVNYEMREKLAKAAALLHPDKQQIDRVTGYLTQNLPVFGEEALKFQKIPQKSENIIAPLIKSISSLYKNTQDDAVLAPLRKLYENSDCNPYCKMLVLQELSDMDFSANDSFYIKILKDPNSDIHHKQMAAYGLAQSGNPEVIPHLREIADHLFDTDEKQGKSNLGAYMKSVQMLGKLGKKHYEASKEIQALITKVCNCDKDKYGFLMKQPRNVMDLFDNLAATGNEENRKFLENLLNKGCNYPNAEQYAKTASRIISDKARTQPKTLP